MDQFATFKNLMAMAAADGRFTDEEVEFLSSRASRWNITDEQFEQSLREIADGTFKAVIPEGRDEQIGMLKNLILTMAADGELDQAEQHLFAEIAVEVGIESDELHQIIDELT